MARDRLLAILTALLAMAGGCCQEDLSRYAPRGPSGEQALLKCLSCEMGQYFMYAEIVTFPTGITTYLTETREEVYSGHSDFFNHAIMRRATSPMFRCACSLLNTYFGDWQRMVIIERIGFAGREYGFVLLGFTASGTKAVTNLVLWDAQHGEWQAGPSLTCARLDARRLCAGIAELDRARALLPPRLFWFPNMHSPLFVLHDIKCDGTALSFAVCGYDRSIGRDLSVGPFPPDYAKAAATVDGWASEAVPLGDPNEGLLWAAGGTYATLLDQVWQSILGTRDKGILGLRCDEPVDSVEHEIRHSGPDAP